MSSQDARTAAWPRYHGKEKLEALAERVWTKGDIDDLEARSILSYIAALEKKVRDASK